jgi:hypothetical protein
MHACSIRGQDSLLFLAHGKNAGRMPDIRSQDAVPHGKINHQAALPSPDFQGSGGTGACRRQADIAGRVPGFSVQSPDDFRHVLPSRLRCLLHRAFHHFRHSRHA